MLHWETLVRLSFSALRTSGKVVARRVRPVGTDLPNPLMDNLCAPAPAQLQAQAQAQLSRESTMCVIILMSLKLEFTLETCFVEAKCLMF